MIQLAKYMLLLTLAVSKIQAENNTISQDAKIAQLEQRAALGKITTLENFEIEKTVKQLNRMFATDRLSVGPKDIEPTDEETKKEKSDIYSGEGPATWPKLYPGCAGLAQSPIDIKPAAAVFDASLLPISWSDYGRTKLKFSNKIKFEYKSGPGVKIQGGGLPNEYEFLQAHFHWASRDAAGSEHTLNGFAAPLELHLVHKIASMDVTAALGRTDGLAVVGYFILSNAEVAHPGMQAFLDAVKNMRRNQTIEDMDFSLMMGLVPNVTSRYFRYQGSLTTPGCQQSVVWTVAEAAIAVTRAQYHAFMDLLESQGQRLTAHFRPPQPLNGRTVYTAAVPGTC